MSHVSPSPDRATARKVLIENLKSAFAAHRSLIDSMTNEEYRAFKRRQSAMYTASSSPTSR